ncbi:MAG: hypothetical protein IPN33_26285 [Saprospiraceae bacterium]|nr:hypothetical protein [Saprospiraceae bacterium]
MKKLLLIFAVLFCSNWLGSQSLDSFSVEINKKREGYDFIETMLQGKKIVLLGELDHGDGSSFSIKTELIKYLHEELGYNTLVFEASFINCDFLWNTIGDSTRFKNQIKIVFIIFGAKLKKRKNYLIILKNNTEKAPH